MTREEIVAALRCCAEIGKCENCAFSIYGVADDDEPNCIEKMVGSAANLIENQQRHIDALMKANDSLKDAIARRDKQIETLKKQVEVMAREQDAMGRRIATREEKQWTKTY